MATTKRPLNTYVAVVKGTKQRVLDQATAIHQKLQKEVLLTGQLRRFAPKEDGAITYPAEDAPVQENARDLLGELRHLTALLLDDVATVDYGNVAARAAIEIDGHVLAKDVPVTHLIWLEKQLVDLRTSLAKALTLDGDREWIEVDSSGVYHAKPVETYKTKKVPKVVTLAPATKEHPAQVQAVAEDVIEGTWSTTKRSGALPAATRTRYLSQLQRVIDAVKVARESANMVEVERAAIGKALLDFAFR